MMKQKNTKYLVYAVLVIGVFTALAYIIPFQQNVPTFAITRGNSEDQVVVLKPMALTECVPEAGFDYCYQDSYSYGGAKASVKLQATDIKGPKSGYGYIDGGIHQYFIDEAYVTLKYTGDRLTVARGLTNEDDPCGNIGCIGDLIPNGNYIIANAPAKQPLYAAFYAWDKATYGSYWAWVAIHFGDFGNPPNYDFYVIDCWDNSDVPEGYFCDKSGSWDTWTAKVKPLPTPTPSPTPTPVPTFQPTPAPSATPPPGSDDNNALIGAVVVVGLFAVALGIVYLRLRK